MKQRTFPRAGITVSEIGFGAWSIGGGWGPLNDEAALRSLNAAYDNGITFYDTALGYGDGHSESLIAQAFAGRREKIVIATKVPPKTYLWPARDDEPLEKVFPTDWIIACTERSLKNLNTDYIDIQQLHTWNDNYTRQDEWRNALLKLKQQGKVRAFGVSIGDWEPYTALEITREGLVDSIQVIYNLFEQRPAEKLFPAALEGGVGIIVRVPFEEGLLTGKFRPGHVFAEGDWRADWMTPERLVETEKRLQAFAPVLQKTGMTMPELALKFILSHPAVTSIIPGMRTPAHVQANVRASEIPELEPAQLEFLYTQAFAHGWDYPWKNE